MEARLNMCHELISMIVINFHVVSSKRTLENLHGNRHESPHPSSVFLHTTRRGNPLAIRISRNAATNYLHHIRASRMCSLVRKLKISLD